MPTIIRIEDKKHFYNETPSLQLDFVDNIKWSYDKNHIFKSIQIGYQRWSAESASGIDDVQTKQTRATIFKQIGQSATQLSTFFAASLAIEQTRRNRVDQTKDWRLDEENMIIALNENISPTYFSPELNENFTNISGINNQSSRYNMRLSPTWNFLRWIYFFRGCLQDYTDTDFKFTQGEGNYDFSAVMDDDSDCILFTNPQVSEDMDVPMTIGGAENDFLHLPDQWEFSFKLSWQQYKTIRNNKKNAILVSQTDDNHEVCFIDELEYDPNTSMANFKVWLGGRTVPVEQGEDLEATPSPSQFGDFTIQPQYGLVIDNIIGSGIPSFTYPASTQQQLSFQDTIASQTLQVNLSGTRVIETTFNISLYVDSIKVSCSAITSDGIQSHFLTLPGSVSPPSDITISIGFGGC